MAITTRALAFASRWFDPQTVSRVFEPLIADWQREWSDATGARRRWVLARGFAAFVCAVIVSSPRVVRQPAPSSVTNRVVTRVARFTLVVACFVTLPFTLAEPGWRIFLLFLLLPGSVAIAFPFAMIAAVDAIRCDHALPPHVERAAATKVALAACVFMFVLVGWAVPAANQIWRTAVAPVAGPPPARGLRELTIVELASDPSLATADEGVHTAARADKIARELNNRLSLSALPAFLLWLRWRVLDLPRRRWSPLPPSILAIAALVGYAWLRNSDRLVEDVVWLHRGAGPWSPFVVLGVLMLLEGWRRERRVRA